jgi:hypothetical protein
MTNNCSLPPAKYRTSCIFASGVHASREIPYIPYIKKGADEPP